MGCNVCKGPPSRLIVRRQSDVLLERQQSTLILYPPPSDALCKSPVASSPPNGNFGDPNQNDSSLKRYMLTPAPTKHQLTGNQRTGPETGANPYMLITNLTEFPVRVVAQYHRHAENLPHWKEYIIHVEKPTRIAWLRKTLLQLEITQGWYRTTIYGPFVGNRLEIDVLRTSTVRKRTVDVDGELVYRTGKNMYPVSIGALHWQCLSRPADGDPNRPSALNVSFTPEEREILFHDSLFSVSLHDEFVCQEVPDTPGTDPCLQKELHSSSRYAVCFAFRHGGNDSELARLP